ncbi:hypothetical protein [Sinorhizobium fredii]|uniref:hypothetical protein n=1 Tax=Rhizobium fredii TaxID=380 RepID=UPI00056BA298|nr:hypothetical protein [Sinorhizobium fredii]
MSLDVAIKYGRLLSVADVQLIFQSALNGLAHIAKDNCAIYDDDECGCPGEPSCSSQDVLIFVTTSIMEYFNGTVFDGFDDMRSYAVK